MCLKMISLPENCILEICVGYASQSHGSEIFDFKNREYFPIKVVYRADGNWAIMDGPFRLSKSLEPEYEPLPSSRTDEYIAEHSWPTLIEAIEAAKQYISNFEGRINEGI